MKATRSIALLLLVAGLGWGLSGWGAGRPSAPAPAGMVYVPAGVYQPLYSSPADSGETPVPAFYLDARPVTNAEYLAFVRANPQWQRSRVGRLFADEAYLQHWASDTSFGSDSLASRPVVNVSWFAAAAYAAWAGKRLPTTAEWERAAAAVDPSDSTTIRSWYSKPSPDVLPAVGSTRANRLGVHDLYGVVWEWVDDFNMAMVTGESRSGEELSQRMFCGSGAVGATSFKDYAAFVRYAFRSGLEAAYTVPNLGFRCAKDVQRNS